MLVWEKIRWPLLYLLIMSLILNSCVSVGQANATDADGPYLIYASDPATSITVCFQTTQTRAATVTYWEKPASAVQASASAANTATVPAAVKIPATARTVTDTPTRFHQLALTGLTSQTTYCYTIAEKMVLYDEGTVFEFTTAATAAQNQFEPYQFIVAGDLQPKDPYTLQTNLITAQAIAREKPLFVVQMGDMSQTGSDRQSWRFLMRSLPLMSSGRAFIGTIGNHEHYLWGSSANFKQYFPYAFPSPKGAYHTITVNQTKLVILDAFDGGVQGASGTMTSEQKRWAETELQQAQTAGTKWIFVFVHLPPLSSGEFPDNLDLRNWLLPLCARYDVDAVFYGHAHFYEHFVYTYGQNGALLDPAHQSAKKPLHLFCIGTAGASLESNYNIFNHAPFRQQSTWYKKDSLGQFQPFTVETSQHNWNKTRFYEPGWQVPGFTNQDKTYYQLPFDPSGTYSADTAINYQSDNEWFGHQYSENSLHYLKIQLTATQAVLSVHYPDNSLMMGPGGKWPQQFTINK